MKTLIKSLVFVAAAVILIFFILIPWQFPSLDPMNLFDNAGSAIEKNLSDKYGGQEIINTDRIWVGAIALVLLALIPYLIYVIFVTNKNKFLAKNMAYFQVIPFGTFELKGIEAARQFLVSLSQNLRNPWDAIVLGQPWFRYIIKKSAGDGVVSIYFGVPKDRVIPFQNAFAGYYDSVQLKELTEEQARELIPIHNSFKATKMSPYDTDHPLPIKMFKSEAGHSDPLDAIIAGIGGGKPSEMDVVVDILVKPVPEHKHLYEKGTKYIQSLREKRLDATDIPLLLATGGDKDHAEQDKISEYEKANIEFVKKRSMAPEKAFKTSIRLYVGGEGDTLMALKSASDSFSVMNSVNTLVSNFIVNPLKLRKKIKLGTWGVHEGFILSTAELVGFLRIPDKKLKCFQYLDTINFQIIRPPTSVNSEIVDQKDMFLLDKDEAEEHLGAMPRPFDDLADAGLTERPVKDSSASDGDDMLDMGDLIDEAGDPLEYIRRLEEEEREAERLDMEADARKKEEEELKRALEEGLAEAERLEAEKLEAERKKKESEGKPEVKKDEDDEGEGEGESGAGEDENFYF